MKKQPSRNQASLDSAVGGLLLTNRILTSGIEITYSTNLQTQELMACLRSQEMRLNEHIKQWKCTATKVSVHFYALKIHIKDKIPKFSCSELMRSNFPKNF